MPHKIFFILRVHKNYTLITKYYMLLIFLQSQFISYWTLPNFRIFGIYEFLAIYEFLPFLDLFLYLFYLVLISLLIQYVCICLQSFFVFEKVTCLF